MAGIRIYIDQLKINYPQTERSGLLGHWSAFSTKQYDTSNVPALYGSLTGALNSGRGWTFSSDRITAGAISGIRSITLFANLSSTTEYILELDTGVYLWANAGTLELKGYTSGYDIWVDGVQTTTITASTWHFIVVTLHATLDATSISLGRAGGIDFSGSLADFKLWRTAMSSDIVSALYDGSDSFPALKWSAMLLWWPLYNSDSSSGIELDHSGNGNTGTISGSLSYLKKQAPPLPRYGLKQRSELCYMTGSNYASTSTMIGDIADSMTMSCWIVATSINRMHVFGFRSSSHRGSIQIDTDGKVMCYVANSSGTFGASTDAGAITAGKLYNITLTASGSDITIYVNYASLKTGTVSATQTSTGVWVGSTNGTSRLFSGFIISCAAWSFAMTSGQVQGIVAGAKMSRYFEGRCVGAWYNTGELTWTDDTSGGNDLTYSGALRKYETFAAAKTRGAFNELMRYGGNRTRAFTFLSDGYVEIPADATVDIQNLSVQFWVKLYSLGKTQTLVSKSSAFVVQVTASDYLRFYCYTPSSSYVQSLTKLQSDVWYNIACTYDGSFMRIYINGEFNTLTGKTGNVTLNANPIRIGSLSSSSQLAEASIGDVLLYGEAIPVWKLTKNYLAGEANYLD